MEDYKEKIKELFLRYYRNIGEEEEKTYLSTKRILEMVGGGNSFKAYQRA
jgi:hypothetical protein|nr:MAG TPA: hypothetical protein [Caudoviricetes sp.]